MIEVKRYLRLKDKGLSWVAKENGEYCVFFKRYNPEDGTELDSEKSIVSLDDIKQYRDKIQTELEGLNVLIPDLEKL